MLQRYEFWTFLNYKILGCLYNSLSLSLSIYIYIYNYILLEESVRLQQKLHNKVVDTLLWRPELILLCLGLEKLTSFDGREVNRKA